MAVKGCAEASARTFATVWMLHSLGFVLLAETWKIGCATLPISIRRTVLIRASTAF
jgi:hypothetical protein